MKKFLTAVLAALALSFTGHAQSVTPSGPIYNWAPVTATGVIVPYLSQLTSLGAPNYYTVTVSVTGTVPSACTFEVESSEDGVKWSTGSTSLSGVVSCAAASGTSIPYHFAYKPVSYVRLKVLSLTGADGTTRINFTYTKGK